MAVRICPHCKTEISASEAAARSNDMECPKCGMRLEVAPGSRTISTLCGLAAGAIGNRLILVGGDVQSSGTGVDVSTSEVDALTIPGGDH